MPSADSHTPKSGKQTSQPLFRNCCAHRSLLLSVCFESVSVRSDLEANCVVRLRPTHAYGMTS